MWRRLNTRRWRHWVTEKRTERRPPETHTPEDIARSSRRNILWHGILTAVFASLMVQASLTRMLALQGMALLLAVPSVAYLAGSLIQRQKLAIVEDRRRGR